MLWSDRRNDRERELRAAQTKLRRLCWVLPLVVALMMLLLRTVPE